VWDGKVLLVQRAIDPRGGKWTLPAGYLEVHETGEAGALRETREEAGIEVTLERLLAVYSVPRVSQIQLMYLARMASPRLDPGPESMAARLYAWDEVPWNELAFPTVEWALRHWHDTLGAAPSVGQNPPGQLGDLPAYVERQERALEALRGR
jgi:ADP-ribose pyrophosphatase YjhB (NUDIX family)